MNGDAVNTGERWHDAHVGCNSCNDASIFDTSRWPVAGLGPRTESSAQEQDAKGSKGSCRKNHLLQLAALVGPFRRNPNAVSRMADPRRRQERSRSALRRIHAKNGMQMHKGTWRALAAAVAAVGLVFSGAASASASPAIPAAALPASGSQVFAHFPDPGAAYMARVAVSHPSSAAVTGQTQDRPPAGHTSSVFPDGTNVNFTTFMYAGASQAVVADGTIFNLEIHQPHVDAPTGIHSLAQVDVGSADGKQQVELGWEVSPEVFQDSSPHLFFDTWIDGQPDLGDPAHFVQINGSCSLYEVLPTGTTQTFVVEQSDGAWWIGYAGQWCGWFPDSVWNNRFTQSGGNMQWFGEVDTFNDASGNTVPPCTDMGDGHWASESDAASFPDIYVIKENTGFLAKFKTFATNPAYYSVHTLSIGGGFRYGGGGAC